MLPKDPCNAYEHITIERSPLPVNENLVKDFQGGSPRASSSCRVKVFHGGCPPHMIAARELSCYHVGGSRYCARHDRAMELIMVVKIGINIVLCMCEKMKAISLKASELQAMKDIAE